MYLIHVHVMCQQILQALEKYLFFHKSDLD